ncbi:esterase [Aliiroseovarius zhejiangensis]|uniref:Esterase n=1 Tax=Aliiroseovarius zhejiangensis TaxID=1632025 RepID=A0ABQ3IWZ9_9RHOB|nr:alpha/beta fold hydrolase [Aliiroseovarius zhejiangensis]GHE94182.1 esterase [Aliiroseovarius zhejiangensis]
MSYALKDFGSYTVGGRLLHVSEGIPRKVQFTRSVSFTVDPRGHFAVEHAYVQYFVPQDRRPGPPAVLVHGGGMSGSCWETTPDGRPGWLHLLLTRGYEVHVIDNVERGRAGFAPGQWDGDPILRSLEEAWTLFRIGPANGFATRTPFPGQLFPVDHFETLARQFVPRWLSTTPLQSAALQAVLERTGPALVICHSQGAEVTFDALSCAPERFMGIIALEPSGLPDEANHAPNPPIVICAGDFLDSDPDWQARALGWDRFAKQKNASRVLGTSAFRPGNSHMMMMDANNAEVLDIALDTLATISL